VTRDYRNALQKASANSTKYTLDKLSITLVFFFLSFILAPTSHNASSPVDTFASTVNAHIITRKTIIVNGSTAHDHSLILQIPPRFTRLFIRDLDIQIDSLARTPPSLWQYFPPPDRATSGTSSAHFFGSPDCLENKPSISHSCILWKTMLFNYKNDSIIATNFYKIS